MASAPVCAAVVVWPTYLRDAPTRRAPVVGELARSKTLDVRTCDGTWCRVEVDGRSGYVDQRNLGDLPPATTFVSTDEPAKCFTSQRAGYKSGETLAYCPRNY